VATRALDDAQPTTLTTLPAFLVFSSDHMHENKSDKVSIHENQSVSFLGYRYVRSGKLSLRDDVLILPP
jgi:hypothetical protein